MDYKRPKPPPDLEYDPEAEPLPISIFLTNITTVQNILRRLDRNIKEISLDLKTLIERQP